MCDLVQNLENSKTISTRGLYGLTKMRSAAPDLIWTGSRSRRRLAMLENRPAVPGCPCAAPPVRGGRHRSGALAFMRRSRCHYGSRCTLAAARWTGCASWRHGSPRRTSPMEKALFHVVPDAQYAVERTGALVVEPQNFGPGVGLIGGVGLGIGYRSASAVPYGVAVFEHFWIGCTSSKP